MAQGRAFDSTGGKRVTNLCVSNICNLSCPFCFADSYLNKQRNGRLTFITLQDYETRLDFLLHYGVDTARLIGGEPGVSVPVFHSALNG